MILTTLDILYIVLSIGVSLLTLTLVYIGIRLGKVLQKVEGIMNEVEDTASTVNTYVKVPAGLFMQMSDWWKKDE